MPPDFHHVANPLTQWANLPSFMLGELLFITSALVALFHAKARGRDHLLIWCAALIAGTANDFIFMALPLVDNFWQAQGTIMLTPRMPLYIPCVYLSFMYWPTISARHLHLPRWSGAALAGLAAALFYAPYDIIGAKFLWWTWHDTDKPIAFRLLGAPSSSTLWVLTFTGSFAWLIDHTLRGRQTLDRNAFARGFLKVAGLSTALMMVQMTLLQQLDGGTPGPIAVTVAFALYAALALPPLFRKPDAHHHPADSLARRMLALYLPALLAIGLLFTPETHRSTGLHQPIGLCHQLSTDITGLTRFEYLCPTDFDEPFALTDEAARQSAATWYTIVGTPHESPTIWRLGLASITALAALLFARIWRRREAV